MRCACVLAAISLVAAVVGCTDSPTQPAPAGSFAYTSYDTTGAAVVTGWFTLDVSDSGAVSGEWHFWGIGNPRDVGPQIGGGALVGGFAEGDLWLELNPQFRDHNLSLHGTLQDDRYAGEWVWSSFVGVTNHGTFEAFRR
jgi:hypothetical protein